jgi:lipopolysaccharide export system permease protein
LTFGTSGRRNEIIALRAGGVSLVQTAVPIVVLATGISIACLLWNETVVPYCSRKSEYVNNIEIRKRAVRGILSDRAIWYHGADGFYNIDYVDRDQQAVYNLTIYRLDDAFQLRSVVTIPRAQWRQGQWQTSGAVEYVFDGDPEQGTAVPAENVSISESLDDFLGGRLQRHPSIAAIVGLGTLVGFLFWVLLGLSTSLGETGAVPPLLAAWAANGIYALVAVALFLWSE